LLVAVNHKGEPDVAARQRGAELVMKNPELLREVEQLEGEDDSLLPGVVLRFPWDGASTDSLISGGGAATEAVSTDQPEPENGTTLSPPPELDLDVDCDLFPAEPDGSGISHIEPNLEATVEAVEDFIADGQAQGGFAPDDFLDEIVAERGIELPPEPTGPDDSNLLDGPTVADLFTEADLPDDA
jgi:hypothetical protein